MPFEISFEPIDTFRVLSSLENLENLGTPGKPGKPGKLREFLSVQQIFFTSSLFLLLLCLYIYRLISPSPIRNC